jgi:uncharacterized protein
MPIFEWDERKRSLNMASHGIDFRQAVHVFEGSPLVFRSDRNGEVRWVAVGTLRSGQVVAVAFTRREEAIRIISVRRARPDEEERYGDHRPVRR